MRSLSAPGRVIPSISRWGPTELGCAPLLSLRFDVIAIRGELTGACLRQAVLPNARRRG